MNRFGSIQVVTPSSSLESQTFALPPNDPITVAYQVTFSVGGFYPQTSGEAAESISPPEEQTIVAELPTLVFDGDPVG